MEKNDLRNTVLNMLISTLEKGNLSHLVLRPVMEDASFSSQDRAYIKRAFTGTLEQLVYLDYAIGSFSSVPIRKMKPLIRNILRMSFYQMRFMDSVPVYSCINEAVRLTKKRGLSNLSGFVNGILRNLDRNADSLVLPDHVAYGVPEWIFSMMIAQYEQMQAKRYFESIRQDHTELTVRLNETNYSREQILHCLEEEGCRICALEDAVGCYLLTGFENLTELKAFQEGMIIIQDPTSAMAVEAAASRLDQPRLILDTCAAPGGKSMYAAMRFPDASVISRDLTDVKISLIRENIKRTGISNITPQVYDALVYDEFMEERCDLVIADLPCSGLGVIRKKPDILYRLKQEDITSLAKLQRDILRTVQSYVKPGGLLLYSTCTLSKEENKDNVEWFRNEFAFDQLEERLFLPGTDPYDGFYYAIFRKEEVKV